MMVLSLILDKYNHTNVLLFVFVLFYVDNRKKMASKKRNVSRARLQDRNSTSRAPFGEEGSQSRRSNTSSNIQRRNELQTQPNLSNSDTTRPASQERINELQSLSNAGTLLILTDAIF